MILAFTLLVLSGILSIIILPASRQIAGKIGLVDSPSEIRKVHKTETPVIGGLLVGFVALPIGAIAVVLDLISGPFIFFIVPFYVLFLFLGVLDDRFDVPAKYKFGVQCMVSIIVVNSGLYLGSLNDLFGVDMPIWFIKLVTVVFIVGVINAYNLVDGIDGLLASFFLIAVTMFIGVSLLLSLESIANFLLIFIGALLVFLKQNMGKKDKIFMGDAGSLSLGFVLVVVFLYLFEKSGDISAQWSWIQVCLVGVLSFPIVDTLIVFSRRLLTSGSVFKADKTHFHHLVLAVFPKHKDATLFIVLLNVGAILMSLLMLSMNLPWMSFFVSPLIFVFTRWVILQIKSFRKAKQIILRMELG